MLLYASLKENFFVDLQSWETSRCLFADVETDEQYLVVLCKGASGDQFKKASSQGKRIPCSKFFREGMVVFGHTGDEFLTGGSGNYSKQTSCLKTEMLSVQFLSTQVWERMA